MSGAPADPVSAAIARAFREERAIVLATLIRQAGDFQLAEDAVQDAFVAAVARWPEAGLPPSPAGWIITTARNKGIDRLRLIFTCCHPALSPETRVALTLREVCDLTAEEIAGAFLTAPSTIGCA